MAQILVRKISESAKASLARRARANKTSLEAEARKILEAAANERPSLGDRADWVDALVTETRRIGLTAKDLANLRRNIEDGRRNRKTFSFDDDA